MRFGEIGTEDDAKQIIGAWDFYVVGYTDLQAAADNGNITIFTAAAGEEIKECLVEPTEAFAGAGITGYTVEVGISVDEDKYKAAFDVTQTADQEWKTEIDDTPSWSGATAIIVTGRSTGANTDQAIAGSVTVHIRSIKIK